jgi:hypothetical protein
MVKDTIGERAELPGDTHPARDAQHPDIQQRNRQQQTREAVYVKKLRQFEVKAARFDVREQLFATKAPGIVAQGALRRAAVSGNKPGIIAGVITRQSKMKRTIALRQGQ